MQKAPKGRRPSRLFPKGTVCTGDTDRSSLLQEMSEGNPEALQEWSYWVDLNQWSQEFRAELRAAKIQRKNPAEVCGPREFAAWVRWALSKGGQIRDSAVILSTTAGGRWPCVAPVPGPRKLRYVPDGEGALAKLKKADKGIVQLFVPCRHCDNCRMRRRQMWIAKAKIEQRRAVRTWFVTLTSNPHHREFVDREASALAWRDRKPPFATLPEAVKIEYRCRAYRREIQLYIKRLRKPFRGKSGGPVIEPKFRYLAITEAHKDGHVHSHLLVHETTADCPIHEVRFRRAWSKRGFAEATVVLDRDRAAFYVSKYLTKDFVGKVQPSLNYGKTV